MCEGLKDLIFKCVSSLSVDDYRDLSLQKETKITSYHFRDEEMYCRPKSMASLK